MLDWRLSFSGNLFLALSVVSAIPAFAADTLVAVAANFSETMEQLQKEFEQSHSHSLRVSTGSTGKLYAQIVNGAPFDILLSADEERPKQLVKNGNAKPENRFTYAIGELVLWSADQSRISVAGDEVLKLRDFRKLAIANPELAPYGRAAMQALQANGIAKSLKDRLVFGENVGQTFAFVASGNAELGLVAHSHVLSARNNGRGSSWAVPAELHDPIRQDAVLLKRGEGNIAARKFIQFLRSNAARSIIRNSGYRVD